MAQQMLQQNGAARDDELELRPARAARQEIAQQQRAQLEQEKTTGAALCLVSR